jgi:hypothetical protein
MIASQAIWLLIAMRKIHLNNRFNRRVKTNRIRWRLTAMLKRSRYWQ